MNKKLMFALAAILTIICLCVVGSTLAYADSDVVYLDVKNGKDTNDGKSDAKPLGSIEAAYGKVSDGGTIVLMSDVTVDGEYTAPEHNGKVTLTSKYNGKTYGAKIVSTKETFFKINGSTVFSDITLKADGEFTFVCEFSPIVFDRGFKVDYKGDKGARIIGGFYSPTTEQTAITDLDSNITINEGDFYLVIGSSKKKGKGTIVHTGTANITVNGGSVDILYGGTHENHAGQDAVININGGEVNKLSCAGDSTRRLYGNATVNLNGGSVKTLDVNNVIGNATVNIVGCAPEKVTVTYKNETLLDMAGKNNAKQTVNYNALICTDAYIKQLTETFDVAVNTTCIYVEANGKGDGSAQDKALGSLAAAYRMIGEGGGRIIVVGEVKCDLTAETLAKYNGPIVISGKDSESAVLFDNSSKNYFESETAFENIILKANGNASLYACYKPFTAQTSVKTIGNISVIGSGDKSASGNVWLALNGGDFQSVVGIGADGSADKIDASISVGGANVKRVTLSEKDAKYGYGVISVSGGNTEAMDTCEKGSFSEMSVKVLGGEIGRLTLNGAEQSLFFNVSHAVFGEEVKAKNIPDKSGSVLLVGTEVDESKLASVRDKFGETKNGNIIYLSDNGTGNGVSPDAPMGDLNAAIKALGAEGSVVIVGTYTIAEKTTIEAHDYPVVITSVGSDRDYRSSGAVLVFGATLYLGGETTFEKVEMSVGQSSTYIYAMANKLTVGDGVNTTLTNSNTAYINIVGGRNDKVIVKKIDVTVSSGDWGIFRAGSTDTTSYNADLDINVTLNGGTFHRYVALTARGQTSGKVNCTVNGGVYLQGIYAAYEQDGKYHKLNYDVTLTLNDGVFYQQIAPARTRDTLINGTYNLYLNGGDYSSVTDVLGSEKFTGYMSSYLHISDKVDINKKEEGTKTFQNPVDPSAPDPWVFYHDGYYYYTHTTGTKIILVKAMNLGDITTSSETVIIQPTEGEDMWSPEIHYFSAEEVGEKNEGWYLFIAYDHGESGTRRSHVLKCKNGDDFFGEWVNPVSGERNKPEKIVFPDFPELDTLGTNGGYSKLVINGKTYMTFIRSVNRGTPEYHQKLCIAEIDTPWSYKGEPVTLAVPEYDWEMHGYGQDSITGGWYPKVIEGASAVYGDNGEVYIMYTGSGYWTKYYQLGYMKYLGGNPLDPSSWVKNPNSILSLSDEVNGCGHGSYFKDHNGDYYVAYHGYLGKDTQGSRYMYIERIYVTADRVYIGNDSGHPAPLSTVYTVSANPMPLADKISGFTEKTDESNKSPFDKITADDTTTASPDVTTDVAGEDGGYAGVIVAVIVVAAVIAAGVVAFVVTKKKKKA